MKTKISIITIYYSFAVVLLCAQAVQTVYQLSQTISYGQRIAKLQKEKDILSQNRMNLSKQISQVSSITYLGEEELKEFKPIQTPTVVSANTSVASR